ncbi:hypothetical protein VTN77DRAFT_799 [Rasamsonia byssochlamydoides]|uniref:uncharacterized protein n=1 Tax=Rasamsonia byssochlamydoides TaxID=89139 RepID=UPI0037440713
MDPETVDPLDWTVDQVVAFLCHNSSAPWSQSANPTRLPDPIAFEAAIRENMINGEVLLTDVDKETLREELGLKALGPRSTVLAAIRYLRNLSVKYQRAYSAQTSVYNDGRPSYSPRMTPMTVSGHISGSPVPYPHFPRQATPHHGMRHGSMSVPPSIPPAQEFKYEPNPGDNLPGRTLQSNGIHLSSETPNLPQTVVDDDVNNRTHGMPNPPRPQFSDEQTVACSVSPRLRPNEHIQVDSQGRKRRKLDLTAQRQAVSDVETPQSQAKDWYMGPSRIEPMDIFYPIQSDSELEESSFVTLSPEIPIAQRLFVKKCLHQFFRQQPVKLGAKDGCSRSAIFPCKSSLLGGNQPQFFTLYSSRNGQVTVTKETTADWPEFSAQRPASGSKNRDPYDYLIEKYPVKGDDEDVLPLFGESGSEGEYDSDTWREIDEEREESVQRKPTYLTSHEVNSVIERCVRDYEEKWRSNHLPKQEHRAYRIWMEAKRRRNRSQQIKMMLQDIELLERRLRKIKKEIHQHKYAKVEDLQFQCQSMEQTVFNIEAQKWRISVLEKAECPPKVPFTAKPRPKKVRLNLDEESLDSESDYLSEDSLDDFIVNDVDAHGDAPMDISMTSSDSDSDDMISPSGKRRKQRQRNGQVKHKNARIQALEMSPSPPIPPATTQQLSPPSYVTVGGQNIEMIDLPKSRSASPVVDFEITTPPLNPARPADEQGGITPLKMEQPSSPPFSVVLPARQSSREMTSKTASPSNRKPDLADIDVDDFKRIQHVKWSVLEDHSDRQRLLTKLIACLPNDERTNMAMSIPTYTRAELRSLTFRALNGMRSHALKIRDLDSAQNEIIMRVASLYVSWNCCVRLNQKGINKSLLDKTIANKSAFDDFASQLSARLAAYTRMVQQEQQAASAADVASPGTEDSDHDDLQAATSRTPHKKRKRQVKESQEVKRNHEAAQIRVAMQEAQRKRLEERMESMGVSNDDPERQAVSFEHPVIYLDSHIGRRVKSHQLNGIQFMWRELIQDEKGEGCLLAHTMGLGKTMQVISLLVTISAAAASEDAAIRNRVPARFHRSQTLILCPSSLIDNWYEEFLMWTPRKHYLGPIRKVTSSATLQQRLAEVAAWDESGGILILSYDIFRTWIHNKETRQRGKPLDDKTHAIVREQLLKGPNIIVADEAHKMKNRASGLSTAASEFKSKSRIALTGSPLANNLVDYFAMVDWIAPGYLGEFIEFKANYVEPIEEGLYADSTFVERRRSLKKLQVLKEILNPKINRADISVLKGSLPPKVEFVITVSLTDLQKKAYNMFVASLLEEKVKGDVRSMMILSWLAILGLCCSHPACFKNRLHERTNNQRRLARRSDDFDQEEMPGDEPIHQIGLPESMIAAQEQLLSSVPDLENPMHSHRAQILDRIISESIKAGDKVLVFSHSLSTLDYLEKLLISSGRRYSRLDGSTPVGVRQAATKNFNNSQTLQQVFLISTRAGGLGLNIPGANRVVIYDFLFNPTWEEQAVGRAYRLGQQKPVFVYRFIAGGTFEEVLHNKAVFKTQLAIRVVDKKNPVRWASKSLGEYLFPVREVKEKDVSEYIGKDPRVLDKIIQDDQDRIIRKIDLTETFQKEDNDKLTDEEKKDVQQELDDERLKRSDPEAYTRKMAERMAAAQAQPQSLPMGTQQSHSLAYRGYLPPNPYLPPGTVGSVTASTSAATSAAGAASTTPVVPYSAHNIGPPPLEPDTSVLNTHSERTASAAGGNTAAALSSISEMGNTSTAPLGTLTTQPATSLDERSRSSTAINHPTVSNGQKEPGPETAGQGRQVSVSSAMRASTVFEGGSL